MFSANETIGLFFSLNVLFIKRSFIRAGAVRDPSSDEYSSSTTFYVTPLQECCLRGPLMCTGPLRGGLCIL
eukprot:9276342-Pyramimonas_sp.AAC.1